MNSIIVIVTLIIILIGVAFTLVFRRLTSSRRTLPVSVEWIHDPSAVRYQPMERLLDGPDYAFLASQGLDRRAIRRLRSERRKIFRGYVRCLSRDFNQVCTAVDLLMVHSQQDRPDLAVILIKQKSFFALGIIALEARLLLHTFGIGTVRVQGLVTALDSLRVELRQLIAAPGSAAA